MLKRLILSAVLLLSSLGAAFAQGAATNIWCLTGSTPAWSQCSGSNPFPVTITGGSVVATIGFTGATTTQAKATVAATNTFQALLASSSTRKGCTIQYVAVAGTKGYVFFGSSTPGDTTTSFQLTNGQSLTCAIAGIGVATDQVLATGTQNDIFIVSNQ